MADLIDAFETMPQAEWETAYASAGVAFDDDALPCALAARKRAVPWLAFRVCAGPPGVALPAPDTALRAVIDGTGTAADAYAVMETGRVLSVNPANTGMLNNAAYAALCGGGGTYFAFLASRSALAWLIAGEPDRAWQWLEVEPAGRPMPWFEDIRALLSLRHTSIPAHPWFRRAIWARWPLLPPRAVPLLPLPDATDVDYDGFRALVDGLQADDPARPILDDGLRRFRRWQGRQLEAHPTVRAIRSAVLSGAESPPEGLDLPQRLEDWVLGESSKGHHEAARLGALALHDCGRLEGVPLFICLLRAARVGDIDRLISASPDSAIAGLLAEVAGVLPGVPEHLQSAVFAGILPLHQDHGNAVALLRSRFDEIQAIPRPAGGAVEKFIEWVVALPPSVVSDPGERAALEAARGWIRERIRDEDAVTVEELQNLVAGAPPVPAGLATLNDANATDALGGVIGGLLALRAQRSQSGGGDPDTIRVLLTATQRLIFDGMLRPLFSLRLQMLEELLAGVQDDAELAAILVQRANTRNGLHLDSPEEIRATIQSLELAMEIAERAGDLGWLIDAVSVWAKTIARGVADRVVPGDMIAEARIRIESLRATHWSGRTGWRLRWAESSLHEYRGPNGEAPRFDLAADAMREVVAAIPADDRFRGDALRDLAHALVNIGEHAEALATAHAALATAPPDTPAVERAFLHHSLAECMQVSGDIEGAEAHYREAVRLGGRTEIEVLPRIRLAAVLAAKDCNDEALDLLERVRASCVAMRREDRIDHASVTIDVAQRTRNIALADRALMEIEPVVLGTEWEATIRLAHAMAQGSFHAFAGAVECYVDGGWLPSREADDIVEHEGWNAAERFSPRLKNKLLAWSGTPARVAMHARMLDVTGRPREGERILREHLRKPLRDDERLRALYLMMGIVASGEASELRSITDEIERLIGSDKAAEDFASLADLAQGLRLGAAGDSTRLERAYRFALRSANGGRSPQVRDHAIAVAGRIILDLLLATAGVSTAATAAVAARFLTLPPMPAGMEKMRFEAARMLLWAGPCTHPDAFVVVSQLLASIESSDDVLALMDRADALRARAEGSVGSIVRVRGVVSESGRYDELPEWIVEITAGRACSLESPVLAMALPEIHFVVTARPDRADDVLSKLLPAALSQRLPERETVLRMFADLVASGEQSTGAWPRLRSLVQELAAVSTDGRIHRLRRAIDRARMATKGDEGPVACLAEMMDTPRDLSGTEEAEFRFERATYAMKAICVAPESPEADAWRSLAVDDLTIAIRRAARGSLRADCTMSLGNALRMQIPPRLDDAIALYQQLAAERDQSCLDLGKLHKLWADGLNERGRDDDRRQAWRHVEQALTHRREGWERMETLWTAAEIARRHPDWPEYRRARERTTLLAHSILAYPKRGGEVADRLLRSLADWSPELADVESIHDVLGRVAEALPSLREEIERAKLGGVDHGSARGTKAIQRAMSSPDLRAVMAVRMQLMTKGELVRSATRFSGANGEQVVSAFAAKGLGSPPHDLAQLSALLTELSAPNATPAGNLVASVHILHLLARMNAVPLSDVCDATNRARQAIHGLPDGETRAWLLSELSDPWNSRNPHGDPFADMNLVAELAQQAIEAAGGEAAAHRDILEHRARSLRYRRGGDLHTNLRESHRLYLEILRRDEADHHASSIANTLNSLGEIEGHIGNGSRLDRARASENRHRRALALAVSDDDRCQYSCNLAWSMTQIATMLPTQEGIAFLKEALALYDSGDRAVLRGTGSHAFENERTVCASLLARLSGDRAGDIAIWRARYAIMDATREPDQWSLACHNLANALLHGDPSLAEVAEGRALGALALTVRTLEFEPRFNWETHLILGTTGARTSRFGVASADAAEWTTRRGHLRAAVVAASVLGDGEELARSAESLLQLAVCAPSAYELQSTADEAWASLQRAAPGLLLDAATAWNQASGATNVAFAVAASSSNSARRLPFGPGAFALLSDKAERVVRWLVRVSAPFQRVAMGLNQPPGGVAADLWMAWRAAVLARAEGGMLSALRLIHAQQPAWLLEESTLAHTWKWLTREPGGVAIGVFPGQDHVLVALLDGNTRRVAVLVLPAPELPLSEAEIATALADPNKAQKLLPLLCGWARAHIVEPVLNFHGTTPKRVLWSAQGAIRMVPPGPILPGIPVSVATSLVLQPPSRARSRGQNVTIFYADPTGDAATLNEEGVLALQGLADADSTARIVAGGHSRTPADLHPRAEIVDATAVQLMRELDHSARVVILAHGRVENHGTAWISCIDKDGTVDRAEAATLAKDPGALAGLSAVLLSCETGRTGDHPALPGGVAGVMLVSGAREVIAPLWPVELSAAAEVGAALLRDASLGIDADVTLAAMHAVADRQGPTLGRPPSAEAQRAARQWSVAAFVRLVG